MWQIGEEGAMLRIPKLDVSIKCSCGKQPSIRGKGEPGNGLVKPVHPEQCATRDIPELEAAIRTSAGQDASIGREREVPCHIAMSGTPTLVENPPPTPHAYFPLPAARRPVRSIAAHDDRQNIIKSLSEDAVLKRSVGQCRILHVNALQKDAAQGKAR
jgi:hypothetical protein